MSRYTDDRRSGHDRRKKPRFTSEGQPYGRRHDDILPAALEDMDDAALADAQERNGAAFAEAIKAAVGSPKEWR